MSTNNTILQVDSDPPKSTYSEDHISAPRGCCRLKFPHALENDQGLLAHAPLATGVPNKFFEMNAKNDAKVCVSAVITVGPLGRAKTVHNLVRFRTTSDFDRKYLQNASMYGQAGNAVITYDLYNA